MKKPPPGFSLPFDFAALVPSVPAPVAAAMKPAAPVEEDRPLSVSELGRTIRRSIDLAFHKSVWVAGEVSGARPAASGHLYFSLKDEEEDATIDVAFYKASLTARARKLIVDGARIRIRGKPSYWAPRGKLQFSADAAEPLGKGALLEALEKLKAKLAAEGLFSAERKRPLPPDPRVIGVVTSAGGAVIHDIRKVAFRRGGARILLSPAVVQGAGAAESIRRALLKLQRVQGVDVIIVGRGGGSTDDLLAFNDEALVRALAACPIPVVSAVGHEVDVTLTDFVADVRAATPSQAAEMVVPDRSARFDLVRDRTRSLVRAIRSRLAEEEIRFGRLSQKMADPRTLLLHAQQLLDERSSALSLQMTRQVRERTDTLASLRTRLAQRHPQVVVAKQRAEIVRFTNSLGRQLRARLSANASRTGALAARLDAMSPLKVLSRGYAIVTKEDGSAVRSASSVRPRERVNIRVDEGTLEAEVISARESRGEG